MQPPPPPYTSAQPSVVATVIPYKNPKALTAYYCGVFSVIPCLALILGPIAFVFGILGLKAAKANPEVKGRAHAWVGIVLGGATFLVNAGSILTVLVLSATARSH